MLALLDSSGSMRGIAVCSFEHAISQFVYVHILVVINTLARVLIGKRLFNIPKAGLPTTNQPATLPHTVAGTETTSSSHVRTTDKVYNPG